MTRVSEAAMTPDQLRQVMAALGIRSKAEIARQLGIDRDTITAMLDGTAKIRRYHALACSALICHLGPWPNVWPFTKGDPNVDMPE